MACALRSKELKIQLIPELQRVRDFYTEVRFFDVMKQRAEVVLPD